MTELKGTKIIAIDHGYGNIKTANTVTPTAITAYDSPPVFTGNILEYEGRWYRIGEGHKEFTPDKAIDEDSIRSISRKPMCISHAACRSDGSVPRGRPSENICSKRKVSGSNSTAPNTASGSQAVRSSRRVTLR